jgi:hypothetical protein
MKAKYSPGNKVLIKPRSVRGGIQDPAILEQANRMGEIVESMNIVAFTAGSPSSGISGERITIYYYTVRINADITLYEVPEDYLEIGN